jgi:hypothetical protein
MPKSLENVRREESHGVSRQRIAALQMEGTNGSGRVEIASASDTLD